VVQVGQGCPRVKGRPKADRVATRSALDAPLGTPPACSPVAWVEDDPLAQRGDGMDRQQFWALIEATKTATGGDCQQQAAQLVAVLGERSVSEVLDYHHIHSWLMAQSYRPELWGAAYLINGGCSDNGFDYFRGWLLGQGQVTWRAALDAPDALASHPQVQARASQHERFDTLDCEAMWGVADRAYQALTGQELTVRVADLHPWPPELEEAWDPGEDWDFDDATEMRRRYPQALGALRLGQHAVSDALTANHGGMS
jgi:hypothetical protein